VEPSAVAVESGTKGTVVNVTGPVNEVLFGESSPFRVVAVAVVEAAADVVVLVTNLTGPLEVEPTVVVVEARADAVLVAVPPAAAVDPAGVPPPPYARGGPGNV